MNWRSRGVPVVKIIKLLGMIFLFFHGALVQAQSTTSQINDRLVQGLECKNISVSAIYSKIREDAYSIQTQIPDANWATGYLANCWSLAHAQRLVFMLSRLASNADFSEAKLRGVLDMFRGSSPEEAARFSNPILQERPLRQYTVFSTDRNFSEGSNLYSLLQQGFSESGFLGIPRNFRNEIEIFQIYHFHRAKNLPMFVGNWERPANENQQSFKQIIQAIDQHRLNLLVLRADRTVQHVVIPKRYEISSDGKYIFHVFDANFPDRENAFAYDPQIQQFEGGSVMGAFYDTPYLTKAVGVFIVDEGENKKIDEALVLYYQKACRNLKN